MFESIEERGGIERNQPRASDARTRREFIAACGCGAASLYLGGCATDPSARYATSAPTPGGRTDTSVWAELAQMALQRTRKGGADYADIRLIETRTQTVRARDQRISAITDGYSGGYGIRALYGGAWGFAAGADWSPEGITNVADRAVEVAKASAMLMKKPVRLAGEPVHHDKVVTPSKIDPFDVPLSDKCDLLLGACEILHRCKEVTRSRGSLWAQRDRKHFASTEGTAIDFDLLATGGGFGGTAIKAGDFQSRSLLLPYLRCGYEQIVEADFVGQAERVADQIVEKINASQPAPGLYDLVLDPAHLALTIHESCGHPTELDRALGYEANYAGTSFLTPDKRGHFRYGSEHVTLMADNMQERGLASTGYDDDGVACQKWPIIEKGIFVGYSTNREVAHEIDETRSRGSCRADGWSSVPIVRISNIGLEPGNETRDSLIAGVDRGILIEGRGSFSIDQKRYNFQFGGDCFWEIKNGKVGAMLKDVIYNGITPEFWASCDGVADRSHRRQHGFITCGKGQPGQSGWMTHAASHARFRGVKVIDPKA